MIFCLRQLQEKLIEQNRPLYMVFVDFSKAFDTVGRTGLWQLLRKYVCPEKFPKMIEALHTGMMANVMLEGNLGIVRCHKWGKIYRANVLSTLLYGAEAWTVYKRQMNKLHAFMMRHLRSIMKITWMDKLTNKEVLERTRLPSMEDLLIRKNLRWTGNLIRMSPDRLPKQVLYSQLSSGHRKRGRPRLRFKDTIKRNLKLRDIKTDTWTSLSQQRDKLIALVK
ncbi:hypothetical protein NP493_153g07014 [Ridgeia piscesae]|uniref:Reverse transcriptase domain-containing protein n=1 Tax=Ridgeia piscesae TaxID=27915 RepID=A0AAD9UFV2_RIDPI|nr:hypothetical protein NP493_153g07014 [Ridgeia piscesae]